MNWQEYKERKEAQRYFRQNNDQFLSAKEWLIVGFKTLFTALVLGVLLALLTQTIHIRFSILYIVIGIAIANVATSTTQISSPQMGLLSAVMTFVSFVLSQLFTLIMFGGFTMSVLIPYLTTSVVSLFTGGIFNIIFIVMGVFCAYQQAS